MMDKNEVVLETLKLPMLAMRGIVCFPKMVLHFDVGRAKSIISLNEAMKNDQKIFLAAQKDMSVDDPQPGDLYSVGVVAEVKQILKLPGGDMIRVLVEGIFRAQAVGIEETDQHFMADILPLPLKKGRVKAGMMDALIRTLKDTFEDYCYLSPKMPKEMVANVSKSEDAEYLSDYIASNILLKVEDKQAVLEETSEVKRLELLIQMLQNENNILAYEKEIYGKVREQIDKNQREYFLREQMKIISGELGESDSYMEEAVELEEKIEKLNLSDEISEKLYKEADKLSRMPSGSHEASVVRNYLDTVLSLPWNKYTAEKIDLEKAKNVLDKDHYGLKKVKERILELMAVRKLAPDIKGQIICLVGPPGVGKTSVAQSMAKAMGKKYSRISLGGMKDESEIRGHRKTYIGAMPGRIINAVKTTGSMNPLILLDEIDKLGNDFRGDPASAMLEVLDSNQNNAFYDHYIEVPFDLSKVLFITTANTLDTIPRPLLDRMEVIELPSYTREEKFQIARKHLIPKQTKRHGLTARSFKLEDSAVYSILDNYTREAGVRNAERTVASLARKAAKGIVAGEAKKVVVNGDNIETYLGPKKYKPETIFAQNLVGVVNGLAWTSVGGELLQIEVSVLDGTGKIELTGSLGDVMKESAKAAVTYVRSLAPMLNINKDFYKTKDIHIHAPEGAVPKDGPSAGVTMVTALVSALCRIPVKRDVAMTGEVTILGRVLPIGGLKEKTMAAYRAGVKTVIIPEENLPDLSEIDDTVKNAIRFISAEKADQVLSNALEYFPCTEEKTEELMPAVLVKRRSDNSIPQ